MDPVHGQPPSLASRFDHQTGELLASFSRPPATGAPVTTSSPGRTAQEKSIQSVIIQFLKMSAPEQRERAHQFKAVLQHANDFSGKTKLVASCAGVYYSTIGRLKGSFVRSTPAQISQSTLGVLTNRNERLLRNHEDCSGTLDRSEAEMILRATPGEKWLLRYSETQSSMVVSRMKSDGTIEHLVPEDKMTTLDNMKGLYGADKLIYDKEMVAIFGANKKGELKELLIKAFNHKDGNPSLCRKVFDNAEAMGLDIEKLLEEVYNANDFVNLEKALMGNDRPNPKILSHLANIYERQGNYSAAASTLEKLKKLQPEKSIEIDAKIGELIPKIRLQRQEMISLFQRVTSNSEFSFRAEQVLDPNLNTVEHLALFVYTTSLYKVMNSILKSNPDRLEGSYASVMEKNLSEADRKALVAAVRQLLPVVNSALEKLPDNKETLYRGAALTPERIAEFQVGATINFESLSSSTTSMSTANRFAVNEAATDRSKRAVIFQIVSKTGKNITKFSMANGEEETLFAPHSKFRVISTDGVVMGKRVIQMEQIV